LVTPIAKSFTPGVYTVIGEQFLSTPITRKESFSSPPNERLAGAACFSSDVTATAKGALDIQAAPA
jgi:hypothetical protein